MKEKINHKGMVPLESERLFLRRLTVKDAQKVFENWTSDDEVSKHVRWDTHLNADVTRAWLKDCEEAAGNLTFYDWGIILKDINEPVGSIGAFLSGQQEDQYEVGYVLGKRYWNMGIATEALKCMMDFLIKEVGIKHFIAKHAVENPASGAVMRHVGFEYAKLCKSKSFSGLREFECKEYYLDLL